jgi:hypothetical protein
MTNKLKGLLIGFSILFIIAFVRSSSQLHFGELDLIEKVSFPFFMGLIGSLIGFLVGSSIKEKN